MLEYGRDSTGKRMQTSKSGFPTKAAAQIALQEVVHTMLADVSVGGYLNPDPPNAFG
ncbi:MAG: Arm DNA-binding domain-containing protein [Dermatophilaceae bacterium]